MAKGNNKKLVSDDIQNISKILSDAGVKDVAKFNKQIERAVTGVKSLGRSMSSTLKKAQIQNQKETTKLSTELEKLYKIQAKGGKVDEKKVVTLEKLERRYKSYGASLDRVNDTAKKQETVMSRLGKAFTNLASQISLASLAAGALQMAISLGMKIFTNWIALQEKWAAAMGQVAMRTGATASQFAGLRAEAERTRGTFGRLTGDVDGIAGSLQFAGELSVAMRTDVMQLGSDTKDAMFRVARGFNLGAEGATNLFRLLNTGVAGAQMSITDFGADLLRFADNIHAPAGVIAQDFMEAQDSIAHFGREGVNTFKRAALMANEFGFETKKIFDMMKGFETFQSASENVNQLNAMFGTALSSFDLMMEADPSRKLEMIRTALRDVGSDWNSMDRFQRASLSQVTGESEANLARIFGEGRTLQQLEDEQAEAARRRATAETNQQNNAEMMNDLLARTTEIFDSWGRVLQEVLNTLSEALGPIFGDLHTDAVGLLHTFSDWIKQLVKTKEFKKFVRDARDFIRDIGRQLKEVKWEDIKHFFREVATKAGEIWRAIKPFAEFLIDHPGIIAAVFAVGVLSQFAGGLGTIAGFMGPTGLIVAGAGLFAMYMADASRATANNVEQMGRLRELERHGQATVAQQEERSTRSASLTSEFNRRLQDTDSSYVESGRGASGALGRGVANSVGNLGIGMAHVFGDQAAVGGAEADLASRNMSLSELVRSRLASGALPTGMSEDLAQLAQRNPDIVRRALGMGQSESLTRPSIRARLDGIRAEVDPDAAAASAGGNSSATSTAPSTQRTASVPATAPVGAGSVINVNSTIQMRDREVGRGFVQAAIGGH